ncbi:MAG: hypothetical protein ACI9OJ_002718, partial [Myxococcota bacterium]
MFVVALFALSLMGCEDELPPDEDDDSEEQCFGPSCDEPDVSPDTGPPDSGPDVPEISDQQCELRWTFESSVGGIPSHPIVNGTGISTIASGDS